MVIMILAWLISPLGVTFTICSLAQFLMKIKPVRIIAWIFQSIIFIFTFFLGIAGILWANSSYREEQYIILISTIGAAIIICLSIIITIISQIIWQRKR
jgi:hypothetical protein